VCRDKLKRIFKCTIETQIETAEQLHRFAMRRIGDSRSFADVAPLDVVSSHLEATANLILKAAAYKTCAVQSPRPAQNVPR
jgi:hypothetical protein